MVLVCTSKHEANARTKIFSKQSASSDNLFRRLINGATAGVPGNLNARATVSSIRSDKPTAIDTYNVI